MLTLKAFFFSSCVKACVTTKNGTRIGFTCRVRTNSTPEPPPSIFYAKQALNNLVVANGGTNAQKLTMKTMLHKYFKLFS